MKLKIILLFMGFSLSIFGKVIYVDDDANAGGDGASWDTAFNYLQDALYDAQYGDEVFIAEGSYHPDEGTGLNYEQEDSTPVFVIKNGVKLVGGFAGDELNSIPTKENSNQTILNGYVGSTSAYHIVSISNSSNQVSLANLYFINGDASSSETLNSKGGAVWISNSSVKFENCQFVMNKAKSQGGAVYAIDSNCTYSNCSFLTNNSENRGGAIFSENTNNRFVNCIFNANEADFGSAIEAQDGHLHISGSKFVNNQSDRSGTVFSTGSTVLNDSIFESNQVKNSSGGVSASGEIFVNQCVFYSNSAIHGGGALGLGGNATINNSIFVANEQTGDNWDNAGGAINVGSYANVKIFNSIFYGNKATSDGYGGAAIWVTDSATLKVNNTISWANYIDGDSSNGHGITLLNTLGDQEWDSYILEEEVKAEYPGDPNAKSPVYVKSNIMQDLNDDPRAFDLDPLFINTTNPIGDDNIWFTEDDGFQLQDTSPAINSGHNLSVAIDTSDLDEDGKSDDLISKTILDVLRIQDSNVDIGAYEKGDLKAEMYSMTFINYPSDGGTITNNVVELEEGDSINIMAVPSLGYVFDKWVGDLNGTTISLVVYADSDKTITANYFKDTKDDDGDGLTNYDEAVTHATDPNDSDSDDDGLSDGLEVSIGSNPNSSDAAVVAYFQNLKTYEEGITDGRTETLDEIVTVVTEVASNYGLDVTDAIEGYSYSDFLDSNGSIDLNEIELIVEQFIDFADTELSPYTNGWFYSRNQGWMWTSKATYPYFYISDKGWMYFKRGYNLPRFYNYDSKSWFDVEE